jgi:hypothetical protein
LRLRLARKEKALRKGGACEKEDGWRACVCVWGGFFCRRGHIIALPVFLPAFRPPPPAPPTRFHPLPNLIPGPLRSTSPPLKTLPKGAWLKEWRKRYFVLKGNKLYFANNPQKEPHGCIDLSECLTVKSAEERTSKKHCFEVRVVCRACMFAGVFPGVFACVLAGMFAGLYALLAQAQATSGLGGVSAPASCASFKTPAAVHLIRPHFA